MTAQPIQPDIESDDSLRRVYGANATFDRVGAFPLVHLDPNADTPTNDAI